MLVDRYLMYVKCNIINDVLFFFFQAEDGIRDAQESRGLGDVYKRQDYRGIGDEDMGDLGRWE